VLSPQAGRQTQASASKADVVIFGGAAGGGKSHWLLLEAARHFQKPGYVAKIFRRTYAQVAGGGGLWDKTFEMFMALQGKANNSDLSWEFPSGASVSFGHLQHEKDKYSHQGKEYAFIGWDELDHFTESQFWYLYSRNRSTCGVRPVVRATINPNPEHFAKDLIRWWLDDKGQFPDLSKAGKLRWFIRAEDQTLVWHDEQPERFYEFVRLMRSEIDPTFEPTSLTFIPSSIDDNPALLSKDPGYKARLLSLPMIERQRLLYGDWLVQASAGMYFKRDWLPINHRAPSDEKIASLVRYWDRAATAPDKPNSDPDYTVGVLMCKTRSDTYQILDVVRMRGTPLDVEQTILRTAQSDREIWGNVHIGIEQDPGQAGKYEAARYLKLLAGHSVKAYPVHKDKRTRANPLSAQAEAGNVSLLVGAWNEPLINELEAFPDGNHDDIVDACSGAFNALTSKKSSFAR
jgi:predicted phage terminase large subunit-like protein